MLPTKQSRDKKKKEQKNLLINNKLLRKLRLKKVSSVLTKLSFVMNTRYVTLNGKSLDLNRKEFELLRYCMNHTDVVLSREALLTEIWGYMDTESRTLDNHIARLRKLGVDNFETVFGVGYKFRQHEKNG